VSFLHSHRPAGFLARLLALAVLLVVAACSDDPISPVPVDETEPAINLQRLLVTDASQPVARLLALHNDSLLSTFNLSAPASYVFASSSGRFGGIQQRTADVVHFVDGGVWAHGDHAHRESPRLLDFQLNDGLPTHPNVNGDWISVFFDGSGSAKWIREQDLAAGNPSVRFEVPTGGPHHSGSATIMVGNTPYFVYAPLNPAGGLPTAVNVRNQQGELVAAVPDCPVMHGNSATTGAAVFGCNNGLVLVRSTGSGITAEKITPSGEMAGLGLRNAWSASGAAFILGQFAALPGQPTRRVLATIDRQSGALNPLPPLPAGVVDHSRAVEPVKGQIVLLGNDGSVYIYNGATRQLQRTVPGVVPALPASGALPHWVAVVEDLAVVASPSTGQVVLVNLQTGAVIRRVTVGGEPSRVAILGVRESGEYEVED